MRTLCGFILPILVMIPQLFNLFFDVTIWHTSNWFVYHMVGLRIPKGSGSHEEFTLLSGVFRK